MVKAHILSGSIVINTIVVHALEPGMLDASLGGSIGDTWDGETFTPQPTPEPTIPSVVTMRQARLALLGAGVLATADAAIAAMPGIEGDAARIEWEYAHEVRRDASLVAGMAAALSLTDEQLDALFVTAAGL